MKATVYFNDADIYSTNIRATNGVGTTLLDVTRYYGDENYTTEEFANSTLIKFTAVAEDDCQFSRWVYRIGSTTATVQYSDDNPFWYSGTDDIYIRAEGGEIGGGGGDDGEDAWQLAIGSFGTVTQKTSRSFVLGEKHVRRYSVVFETSGTAKFYTESSDDTYGYLSTNDEFDGENGCPYYTPIAENDDGDSGYDFYISCDVVANTTYYVWVRSYSGDSTGTIELYVEPPTTSSSSLHYWDWMTPYSHSSLPQLLIAQEVISQPDNDTEYFRAVVWSDMVEMAWLLVKATTNWWDSHYADLSTTQYLKQNEDGLYELTADSFNSLRHNLNFVGKYLNIGRLSEESEVVEPNDINYPVKASYFLEIVNFMNRCLDNL